MKSEHKPYGLYEKYFKEGLDNNEIIELILNSQTGDGIIADINISAPSQTVFSTALCLIALYLCHGEKYRAFANRSIKYLKNRDSYFAKTALSLWDGSQIDLKQLKEKLEMKIMNERLDELAILLIQSLLKDY